MQIEKPDFKELLLSNFPVTDINSWFDSKVEPINKMLAEGVEIYQELKLMDSLWDTDKDSHNMKFDTKALIINIRPIKRETKEDFIRDWIAYEECEIKKSGPYVSSHIPDLIKRAKAVLKASK